MTTTCHLSVQQSHVPILVTENGIATSDDKRRIACTAIALNDMADAIADGIDIRSICTGACLTTSNGTTGKPPSDSLTVSRETFERHPKPSFGWLSVALSGSSCESEDPYDHQRTILVTLSACYRVAEKRCIDSPPLPHGRHSSTGAGAPLVAKPTHAFIIRRDRSTRAGVAPTSGIRSTVPKT